MNKMCQGLSYLQLKFTGVAGTDFSFLLDEFRLTFFFFTIFTPTDDVLEAGVAIRALSVEVDIGVAISTLSGATVAILFKVLYRRHTEKDTKIICYPLPDRPLT